MKITCEHCGHTAEYDESEIYSHCLMCGDSTKTNDVECLMGGHKADILVASPPYNVGTGANLRQHYEKGQQKIESLYGEYNESVNWFELMHELNNAFEFVVCLDNDTSTRVIRYGNFRGNISNLLETKWNKTNLPMFTKRFIRLNL